MDLFDSVEDDVRPSTLEEEIVLWLAPLLAQRLAHPLHALENCSLPVLLDLAQSDPHLHTKLLRDPQVVQGLKPWAAEAKALKKARREHAAQLRAARTSARALGIRCWTVVARSPAQAQAALAVESALTAPGWSWSAVNDEVEPAWSLRLPGKATKCLVTWEQLESRAGLAASSPAAFRFGVEMQVRHSLLLDVPARTSPAVLPSLARTISEVANHLAKAVPSLTVRAWRVVAKVPAASRWALLTEAARSAELVDVRQLNWARFSLARKSRALRWDATPRTAQWELLTGLPAPSFKLPALTGLRIRTLKDLATAAGAAFDQNLVHDRGLLMPLLALARLFGDVEAVRRFVQKAGYAWDQKGLHDAGQFTLPASDGWTPAKWAALCQRHPLAVTFASEFEKLEKAGELPKSWAELQSAVLRRKYPEVLPEFEEMLKGCLSYKLAPSVVTSAQAFWQKATVKPAEYLPHLSISGDAVGLSAAWRFERLASTDWRGPLLGHLTGCCQHLDGAGAACARHGVESPFSAFYVVTFQGKVLAQSWAWRTSNDGLVFDSVEGRALDADQRAAVARLYKRAAERLLTGPLAVKGVFIGDTDSGVTRDITRLMGVSAYAPQYRQAFVDQCDYADGRRHFLVAGRALKTAVRTPQVCGYQVERDAYRDAMAEALHAELTDRWGAPLSLEGLELASVWRDEGLRQEPPVARPRRTRKPRQPAA